MEETWEASRAGQGTPGTMAGLEAREAMVGQGSPWPWLCARPPRQRIYSPPPKIFMGKLPSGGHSGGTGSRGRSGGRIHRGAQDGWAGLRDGWAEPAGTRDGWA